MWSNCAVTCNLILTGYLGVPTTERFFVNGLSSRKAAVEAEACTFGF